MACCRGGLQGVLKGVAGGGPRNGKWARFALYSDTPPTISSPHTAHVSWHLCPSSFWRRGGRPRFFGAVPGDTFLDETSGVRGGSMGDSFRRDRRGERPGQEAISLGIKHKRCHATSKVSYRTQQFLRRGVIRRVAPLWEVVVCLCLHGLLAPTAVASLLICVHNT